ncbi:MAG: thioredoxin domain-containing protein [Firmicutes bacterium]|nr:thioredoxin domain-containing protein [Bacillota bacterium]
MLKNHLAGEKSPYLLQHQHNPVDWYPWGEEAFTKAMEENKPIFLSIGYSTCHWCHVMERESFENHEIAALMNEAFVCVKVDREERPDIDSIYMTVCQMLTGSGGWPLTIIMTPDKRPFYAATYIPAESIYGRPGMMELIPRIRLLWKESGKSINVSADEINEALNAMSFDNPGAEPDQSVCAIACKQLERRFDSYWGGFGNQPKFPTPHNLMFLLRHWKRTGNKKALEMVEKTLDEMGKGGIFDHAGFGFHRYSTDRKWLVPHFEKMLYDQALLMMAYTEAYQVSGKSEYKEKVEQIFDYVSRELLSPEGGFYCAEDADSEGVEGKFYVWNYNELMNILEPEELALASKVFNIERFGNCTDEASGEDTGWNILHKKHPVSVIAKELSLSEEKLNSELESVRKKIFDVREKRIRPHKDDKILTDWNGLMIAALAKAARFCGNKQMFDAAAKAVKFAEEKMKAPDGRLFHRYREGEASINGFLDDYAFMVWGLIELYQTSLETSYLVQAMDYMIAAGVRFLDQNSGGFYFTPDDGEELLVRKKEIYDGAVPSGNSVMFSNLSKLFRITGNPEFKKVAQQLAVNFGGEISKTPSAYTMFLSATEEAVGVTTEIVIAGDKDNPDFQDVTDSANTGFEPGCVIVYLPHSITKEKTDILNICPFLENMRSVENKTLIYRCSDGKCEVN